MWELSKKLKTGLISGLGAACILAACQQAESPVPAPEQVDRSAAKTIFLVRHAEKEKDQGDDPDLTEEGRERAEELARILSTEDLSRIYSSPFARTQQTAAPIADATGLVVYYYDPRDLPALALRLKAECGVCLVVGHSDTTPELAGLLGGERGTKINDDGEYDRLYVIVIEYPSLENGQNEPVVSSEIRRYGRPYGN